jgi:hypothetical protein
MKKNRFLTFVLSLIPGCGLMYLGYMKKGLQIMLMTVTAGYLAYFTDAVFFDWLMIIFLLLLPVIWFYQIFDAMHSLTRMRKKEIETPSDDGFFFPEGIFAITPVKNRTVAKATALVLIVIGIMGIIYGALNNLYYFIGWEMQNTILDLMRRFVVPALASIVLIAVGIKLLKGSKTDNMKVSDDNGGIE